MSSLVHDETPVEFFREQVEKALKHQHVATSAFTEYYLVNLLAGCVAGDPLPAPEPGYDETPLALLLTRALEADRVERTRLLRCLGDSALFMSGFFADSLGGRLVDASYYQALGGQAYLRLSRDEASVVWSGSVFSELAAPLRPVRGRAVGGGGVEPPGRRPLGPRALRALGADEEPPRGARCWRSAASSRSRAARGGCSDGRRTRACCGRRPAPPRSLLRPRPAAARHRLPAGRARRGRLPGCRQPRAGHRGRRRAVARGRAGAGGAGAGSAATIRACGSTAATWATFCTVTEEVSHFLFLLFRAGCGRAVSQLELELQAEVDKYLSAVILLSLQNEGAVSARLRELLFRRYRLDERVGAERAAPLPRGQRPGLPLLRLAGGALPAAGPPAGAAARGPALLPAWASGRNWRRSRSSTETGGPAGVGAGSVALSVLRRIRLPFRAPFRVLEDAPVWP